MDDLERFMRKVEIDPDGCWAWKAARDSSGYGLFFVEGRLVGAHRYAFERLGGGPIPPGFECHHRCRRRDCVGYPIGHLALLTKAENAAMQRPRPVRTHCRNGHAYDSQNTRVMPSGGRRCRTCAREARLRHRVRTSCARASRD